jgi:hypothetical protein
MTVSKRVANAKSSKYHQNVFKRGQVEMAGAEKTKSQIPVGPIVLSFFVFVVIGSAILQIIQQATSRDRPPV